MLCATKPDAPIAPWNENNLDQVNIYWQAPIENGLPITHYIVQVITSENTWLQELTYCDGSTAEIVALTECTVPLSQFKNAPFALAINEHIYVRVAAANLYGVSDFSPVGHGALIHEVPDAPINLVNLPEITSATQIGLKWEAGANNGGSEVIDFTIDYD